MRNKCSLASGIVFLGLLVYGCGGDSGSTPTAPPTPPTPVATAVVVSPNSVSLDAIGKTAQLSASVKDQNGATMSGASVSWSSSSTNATVSSSGLVTAAAEGAAIITATSGAANGTAAVTITLAVASIELNSTALTFSSYGDTTQLTATAKDGSGTTLSDASITWSTSAESVATISSSGLVTSVAAGTATITATSGSVSATASVTATDDQVPTVEWTTTSLSYNDELYGSVDVNVTTSDNYLIDSISFFIDGTRYAYTGCGGASTDSSNPITGSTAACDGTSAVFVFTWNSVLSAGGVRPLKTTVYDQTGNSMTLAGNVTLMHQPDLKYVNHLLLSTLVQTKTSGGAVLTTDTVPAQDSISGYARVPSGDSTRVSWEVIRGARVQDDAPYGLDIGAYWSGQDPSSNIRFPIDNVTSTKTYYYPLWRNSSGLTTTPYIDLGLASEYNICWSSTQGKFLCSIPSDSLLYGTGYYEYTSTSDAAFRTQVDLTTVSAGYWHWNSTEISAAMTSLSGGAEFHCGTHVNSAGSSCFSWLSTGSQQEAAAEGVSAQNGMLAGDVSRLNPDQTMNVMIDGVEHTFLVNTEHLRGTSIIDEDVSKIPEMLGIMHEPVLDSSPITLPIVGEEIPGRLNDVP